MSFDDGGGLYQISSGFLLSFPPFPFTKTWEQKLKYQAYRASIAAAVKLRNFVIEMKRFDHPESVSDICQ